MMKKTLSILLFTLLFFSLLIPSTITAKAEEEIKPTSGLASYLKINWTHSSKPIIPIDEVRYYTIKIDYSVTLGPLGRLFLPFFVGRQVDIKLDIIDTNPWCNANIAIGTLTTQVQPQGATTSQTTQILIELDKDAPAYDSGYVKIRAKVPKIGMIAGYEQDFTIKFKPAYLALIKAELPQGKSIKISPYTETIIPINVTNLGNARTIIHFEIDNTSESFNISIEEIILDVDSKATAELFLFTDHKFNKEPIKIKMTPLRADNPRPEDEGSPISLTLIVKNDGSYVEGLFEIDITIIIIILVIIILIIVHIAVAYKILKRNK
jgi:hypothetical protein